jgi:hypothetical protein
LKEILKKSKRFQQKKRVKFLKNLTFKNVINLVLAFVSGIRLKPFKAATNTKHFLTGKNFRNKNTSLKQKRRKRMRAAKK